MGEKRRTHFKDRNFLLPIEADRGDGFVDKWIVYGTVDGKQLFSARELTLEPGARCTLKDPAASGWITVSGTGAAGRIEFANTDFDPIW